jgi:hypothetical protein
VVMHCTYVATKKTAREATQSKQISIRETDISEAQRQDRFVQ